MPEREPVVLFIGGSARSGSTLLDRMLGQIEGFLSAGEVRFVWRRGFHENRRCGCGERFRDCAFWSGVAEATLPGADGTDVAEVLRLQDRVDRWWRIPELVATSPQGSFRRDLERYLELLGRLYTAMSEISGADVIVDSSKDAHHGYLLSLLWGRVDLRVLHLVRDSRAVAYSLCERRKFDPDTGRDLERRGPMRAGVAWSATNLLIHPLRGRSSGFERMRYEDVVAEPRAALARIMTLTGNEDRSIPPFDAERAEIAPTHIVAGNPMRFERGPIRIGLDDEWRRAMSARARTVVTGLTWPLLAAYGRPRSGWKPGERPRAGSGPFAERAKQPSPEAG